MGVRRWMCLCVLLHCLPVGGATTNTAAGLTSQDIYDAAASLTHGDWIQLPSGTGYLTTNVILSKHLNIFGQGTNETILVDEIVSRTTPLFFYVTNLNFYTQTFTLSQVQLRGGVTNTGITGSGNGFVNIVGSVWRTNAGPYAQWRVYDVLFQKPNGRPLHFLGFGNGLFDQNVVVYRDDGAASGLVNIGGGPTDLGHGSWAADADYGGWQGKFYMERNAVYGVVNRAIMDGWGGARYVVRSNYFNKVSVHNHGLDTSGQFRSARMMEIYGNEFDGTGTQSEAAIHSRGGSGVIWGNAVNGAIYPSLFRMANYRIWFNGSLPYGMANGTNVFDVNEATLYASGTHTGTNSSPLYLVDSGASFTPNEFALNAHVINIASGRASQIRSNSATEIFCVADLHGVTTYFTNGNSYEVRRIIKTIDGNGRGNGALLTGTSSTIPPTPQEWPNQSDEGWYVWDNTGTGGIGNSDDYTIVENRDWFTTNKLYTPLGVHPLAGGSTNPPAGTTIIATNFNGGTVIFGP